MLMDKLLLVNDGKETEIEIPQYGEIKVIVQDGKIMRLETTTTQKVG